MTFAFVAVSSLALLAAGVCFALLLCEKKRSEKRNAALLQYFDEQIKGIDTQTDQRLQALATGFSEDLTKAEKRISDLESGTVPDFEKAKAAADAVNDFNAGISGILGFDPHAVLKKQRNNPAGGENG